MSSYTIPVVKQPSPVVENEVLLLASGDLRQSANKVCWPAQAAMEQQLIEAFRQEGITVRRAHPYIEELGHGFIYNQRMGMDVFATIDPQAPIIVAEAVWQYSHNVLAGLQSHRGPILTVANWSGQWPGLVGMLNLNGCLHKAGVEFSTIWSKDFDDAFFRDGLQQWLKQKKIHHVPSHVRDVEIEGLPKPEAQLGIALAKTLQARKAIFGVFDEGCMGMSNAIVEDYLLNAAGVYKERLSQSALVVAMRDVSDAEAHAIRTWLDKAGMTFHTGTNEETELTDRQILEQCRMYIAALRIADAFGCDAIGIQYQQGLKDLTPASDLVEGLLNNVERPPAFDQSGKELFAGKALPHFNEVDECAGLDALVTNRVWSAMGLDPATTLHDVRWGEHYKGEGIDDFVWLFQISGAAPASHFQGGYKQAVSERQPPMYFRLGGGTLKGICKPGTVVWSRVFVEGAKLHVDMGLATVVELPEAETQRRWQSVTSQWPIMQAVLHGVSRDQFMARHRANHLNVTYAPGLEVAQKALAAKAAMMAELGLHVHFCESSGTQNELPLNLKSKIKGEMKMSVAQTAAKQYSMLIDGEYVTRSKMIPVLNPATEEVISEVPEADAGFVQDAVSAAARAQELWARLPAIKRATHLHEIANALRAKKEYLARIITEEQGKILPLARVEVDFSADYLDYMAGMARSYEGEIIQSDRPGENILLYKAPIGVVAGILPWNFPFFLIVRKMAPALVTGNTIVIKPSEETPNNACEFAKIVAESSLPRGVFNLVTGTGPSVGMALASHPGIGMVSLTGSVAAGSAVMQAAAPNITKVSLELGGKAPAIVMDDADLDLAVKAIRDSRIINTGQVCNCAERVYVHERIAEEFIKRIATAMQLTKSGDPFEDGIEMGPLVNKAQLCRVESAVEQALKDGAELVLGGERDGSGKGFFYKPTVLINCRQNSAIMQKEIFGPVLPITTFSSLDEAMTMANDCEYGLTSSIFTRSLDAAMRAANELKFGETYVNREHFEAMQGFHAGWRKSGIGGADGKHGLEEFLQTRVVYMNYKH